MDWGGMVVEEGYLSLWLVDGMVGEAVCVGERWDR